MDKVAQRLCAGLFGTAAIIFAFAFLIRTASPAQAADEPQNTYATGKYMMQLSAVEADNRVNWYFLVWNTETGHSKFYYSNKDDGLGVANSAYQLPSSPL